MINVLGRWEITPTVPITGILLNRHDEICQALEGADVAVHGFRHISYDGLSLTEQESDLNSAIAAFARGGFDPRGFRAPYLRANLATISALTKRGFLWDSSASRFILPKDSPAFSRSVSLAEARYGPTGDTSASSRPTAGPIELPVCLPDDEILVDGLGLSNGSALVSIYQDMLDVVRRTGGLLVLQVHPERFPICREAVEIVLRQASDDGAFKGSLTEVGDLLIGSEDRKGWPNGSLYGLAVSGDLDAVDVGDFASRFLGG